MTTVLVALLFGCSGGGEVDADFTLRLVPRFIDGQDVLGDDPEIKLFLRTPQGAESVQYVGQASKGTELTLGDLGPLEAGTLVGIIAEQAGSTGDTWDPSATLAYGQVLVTEELAAGEQQVELGVLVPSSTEIGKLGDLTSAKRRSSGAIAVLPGGDVYLFGGGDPEASFDPVSSKAVLALQGKNEGATTFENVGNIPGFIDWDYSVEQKSRAAMAATVVEVDGASRILVTGGRGDWLSPWDNVAGWFLWDPETDTVADQGELELTRSEHLAIPFSNGDVLLYGGLEGLGYLNETYEIFDVGRMRSELGSNGARVESNYFKAFGSPLGQDAVVCGGYFLGGGYSSLTWTPIDGCTRFQPDGDIESFDALPNPLAGAAMVELPDGGLLVTGGCPDVVLDAGADFGVEPAVADAWVHDGGSWRAVGPMAFPRSGHRMVGLADGRVLIVGGTEDATGLFGDVTTPVRCPEVFDPADDSFTQVECTDVGQGTEPLVAAAPGEGAFVIEGRFSVNVGAFVGASEYGVISLGPPL